MRDWTQEWDQVLEKASGLSFGPDWHIIFRGCPYTVQVRAELRKEFYRRRAEALGRILRQEESQIGLRKYLEAFSGYLESEDGLDMQQTFEGRKEMFATLLCRDNIDSLTKDDIVEIVHYSWAPEGWWSDFPYQAMSVLQKSGLPKLRKALKKLLYGPDSLDKRFDSFNKNVVGLGAKYVSDILAFTFPQKYCLWNRIAADASILLGINNDLPYDLWKLRMKVKGEDYVECCRTLKEVKEGLNDSGFQQPDFTDIYHFMLFIYNKIIKQPGLLEGIRAFMRARRGV